MAVLSAGFIAGVLGFAVEARRRPIRTGAEEMIGSTGEVIGWSGKEGRVLVHGEVWAARSGKSLAAGRTVRVVGRTGLTLDVEESP
jgi:membrane-bound serine protease (ClpP class)